MREASFFIEQPFSRGLRPENNFLNREGFLEMCLNMVPDEAGMKGYEGPIDPFQGGQALAFPLPQVFVGRDITLLAGTTSVEEVNTSVSPWTKTTLTTLDIGDRKSNYAIQEGGVWHFADLGKAWYLTNGKTVVFRTGLDSMVGEATQTWAQDAVKVNTLTEHRGRVYIGGMDEDNVWSRFPVSISNLTSNLGDIPFTLGDEGPGGNWVFWGSIGGGDFPLWLFWPDGYSTLQPDKDDLLRRIKRNQFGWMPMRWPGTVQVLKPLGDSVIVYGDNGITALVPQGGAVGRREIARFGVLGRGAVGGDEEGHIFIDQDGVLWALGANLNLSRLGYEEWLSPFSSSSTVISLKPAPEDLREYYLSGPEENYVLNSNGLAQHPDQITSIPYLDGTFYAVHTSAASTDIRLQTSAFDVRRQAFKTIHDLQVLYSDITNLRVAVLYRYNHTEAFRTWGPVKVNPQGVVTCMVTALEFKIRLLGTPGDNPQVTGIEVRWNLVDKRSVRGLYTEQDVQE